MNARGRLSVHVAHFVNRPWRKQHRVSRRKHARAKVASGDLVLDQRAFDNGDGAGRVAVIVQRHTLALRPADDPHLVALGCEQPHRPSLAFVMTHDRLPERRSSGDPGRDVHEELVLDGLGPADDGGRMHASEDSP